MQELDSVDILKNRRLAPDRAPSSACRSLPISSSLPSLIELDQFRNLAAVNFRRRKSQFLFERLLQDSMLRFSQNTSGTTSQ